MSLDSDRDDVGVRDSVLEMSDRDVVQSTWIDVGVSDRRRVLEFSSPELNDIGNALTNSGIYMARPRCWQLMSSSHDCVYIFVATALRR